MRSILAGLRTLVLPWGAPPNASAIILGPDLPPCMQARYSSAIFFRPPNTATGGITGGIWHFKAQRKTQASTEEGYLLYDQTSVCGFVVSRVLLGANDTFGNIGVLEQFTPQFAGGSSAYVANAFKWQIVGNAAAGLPAAMLIGDVGTAPNLTPFLIDGKAAPRGILDSVSSTGSSAATAAEIVSLTGNSFTLPNNHVMEVKLTGQVLTSVANQAAFMSIRRNGLAGTLLGITGVNATFTTVANHYEYTLLVRNVSGADITDNLVSTISRAAGAGTVQDFGSGGTQQRTMTTRDVGAPTNYDANIVQF